MLKTIYDKAEDIPEGYADLYTERNGKWELTGIQGVKTQADVERVQEALRKEKLDHKATKDTLKPFEGFDAEVIAAQTHELEEAQAQLAALKKDGSIDEAKLEPIIAARVAQKVAPMERDLRNAQAQIGVKDKALTEKDGEVVALKSSITAGEIDRNIRDAAVEAKVLGPAIADAVLHGRGIFERTEDGRIITKDNIGGVVPGLSVKEWLKDQIEKSPHWWPASVGGGSNGSGKGGNVSRANNPWSKAGWNITKQGALVRELGEVKAGEIAAQVGCKIGATKPAAD